MTFAEEVEVVREPLLISPKELSKEIDASLVTISTQERKE